MLENALDPSKKQIVLHCTLCESKSTLAAVNMKVWLRLYILPPIIEKCNTFTPQIPSATNVM